MSVSDSRAERLFGDGATAFDLVPDPDGPIGRVRGIFLHRATPFGAEEAAMSWM